MKCFYAMTMKYIFLLIITSFLFKFGTAQQIIPLYNGVVPNSRPVKMEEVRRADAVVDTVITKVAKPDLTVYTVSAAANKHAAVIICPGGGYGVLCIKWEGDRIAKAFNKAGITAIVLKYRLPDSTTEVDPSMAPLQDLQQAIKIVREGADKWQIDKNKIGIMGFSAGGHLASTAGTHFTHSYIDNATNTNLRPDFMILVYPVISFSDSIGHIGSRDNLLGTKNNPEKIHFFSNELHVTEKTPPTLLVLANDDQVVAPANSFVFLQALRHHHVSASLHLYAKGDHGFLHEPSIDEWFGRVLYWMKEMHYVSMFSQR